MNKNQNRDPKTGRFVSSKGTGPQASSMTVGQKIHKVLTAGIKVFGKKDISGTPTTMAQGSSVILEKTSEIGPTGTAVVRVKKENSTRTFYTVEENIS